MREYLYLQSSYRACLSVRIDVFYFKYIISLRQVSVRSLFSIIGYQPVLLIGQKPVVILLLFLRVRQVVESQGKVAVVIIQYNFIDKRDTLVEYDLIIYLFPYFYGTVVNLQSRYQYPFIDRISIHVIRIKVSHTLIIPEEQRIISKQN